MERYTLFSVREFKANDGAEKTDWTQVGVAFPHKDGKGFQIELHALPLNGKLVARLYEPKEDNAS